MSLPHFFTSPDLIGVRNVALHGDEAYHASKSLRIRVGETISVADGTGRVVDAVVTESSAEQVVGRVILVHEFRPHIPKLTLWQGLPKSAVIDEVIQKSVELGARKIVPFAAERSVPVWDTEKRFKALGRWQAVALAAAKQCRSPWETEIGLLALSASELFGSPELVIVLHEEGQTKLRDALPKEPPAAITFVVGPEGGLSEAEIESIAGVVVTLGDRILRTETAGPTALAVASYQYGILG